MGGGAPRADWFSARLLRKPRLCALATEQTDPSPSLLLIANNVDYVFRLWPYFINKVMWASTTKHRLSIWIGELPKIVAAKSGDGCRASKQKQSLYSRRLKQSYYASQRQKSSNHHAKMLAAYGCSPILMLRACTTWTWTPT